MTDKYRLTAALFAIVSDEGDVWIANSLITDLHVDGVVRIPGCDLVDVVKLIIAHRPDIATLVAAAAHDAGYKIGRAEVAPPVPVDQPAVTKPPTIDAIVARLTAEHPYGPGQVYGALLDLCRVVAANLAPDNGGQSRLYTGTFAGPIGDAEPSAPGDPPAVAPDLTLMKLNGRVRTVGARTDALETLARKFEGAIYNSTTGLLDRLRTVEVGAEGVRLLREKLQEVEAGGSRMHERLLALEGPQRQRELANSRDGRADEDLTTGDETADEIRALAAVVEGQQAVIDALISRCDAIDQAKASATWVADLASRDWVKDQIGLAITKHAGAMHARIEQILALAKRYTDAAVSRPGLARRLWSAFVAAPAVAERVPGAAAAQAVGHVFTTAEVERAVVAAVAKAAGSEVKP